MIQNQTIKEERFIENNEGKKITPSIVYFKNEGETIVGEQAKRNMIVYPENTVVSIKREMGTDFKKKIGRHKFPPEYIGAQIFKKLADDAKIRLGKTFNDIVVSVPANYSDSQRQSIKDAAEIAGLNVLRMINEPTAAALAYGIREDRDRKVLVYDFGGGTFDVSILSISSGFFDVDASAGEHRLGGQESIEVSVTNISTRDALTLYLSPGQTIMSLKTELEQKGLMCGTDNIFFDDIELKDPQRISEIKITGGSTLEIRQK